MHEADISVASIPVHERKEEAISISRKHRSQDLSYKKAKTEDEGGTILPGKELRQKKKKRTIS